MNVKILTTEHGVNIEKRIEDGETTIFDSIFLAENYARERRSYHYPVYCNGSTNGQYAVPN